MLIKKKKRTCENRVELWYSVVLHFRAMSRNEIELQFEFRSFSNFLSKMIALNSLRSKYALIPNESAGNDLKSIFFQVNVSYQK